MPADCKSAKRQSATLRYGKHYWTQLRSADGPNLHDCNQAGVESSQWRGTSSSMQTKVLVVEDDSDVRELISFTLQEAGYSVATAMDELQALTQARA